jgi:uncharacterized protein YndB with AHSA1/START domain
MNITVEEYIEAPPDDVFAAATDIDHWPERIKDIVAIERCTDGPVGVGTRFRETRVVMKKEHTEEMTFTEFTPNSAYTLGCESCGCAYATRFQFSPEGIGTRIHMNMTAHANSLPAKILAPLMGIIMKGTMKKCLASDLQSLKHCLEVDAIPAS